MTRSYLGYVSSQTTDVLPIAGGYGIATGGSSSSITVGGDAYTLLTFTSTGTLTVTQGGMFDVLVVGGGGGGGRYGGGGAGGYPIITTLSVPTTGNYTITVGAGGTGSTTYPTEGATNGDDSSIVIGSQTVLSKGGTRGATGDDRAGYAGFIGGAPSSGGGAAAVGAIQGFLTVGDTTGIVTSTGGTHSTSATAYGAGGGGSRVASGGNGSGSSGGTGAIGFDASAFRGESAATTRYGAGGGGGSNGGTVANGGTGGGGNGGGTVAGTAGSANTGSGGGGGGYLAPNTLNGGNGGSGIVLVRFKV